MTGSEMGRFIVGFLGIGAILFGVALGLILLVAGAIAFFVFSVHWWAFLPACVAFIFAGYGYLGFKLVEYLDRRDARQNAEERGNASSPMPIEVAKVFLVAADRKTSETMVHWYIGERPIAHGFCEDHSIYIHPTNKFDNTKFEKPEADQLWDLGVKK